MKSANNDMNRRVERKFDSSQNDVVTAIGGLVFRTWKGHLILWKTLLEMLRFPEYQK